MDVEIVFHKKFGLYNLKILMRNYDRVKSGVTYKDEILLRIVHYTTRARRKVFRQGGSLFIRPRETRVTITRVEIT